MTVMAAEAAEGAATGAVRRGGRTQQGARQRPRAGGRTQQGTQGRRQAPTAQPKRQGGSQRGGGKPERRKGGPFGETGKGGSTNHQTIILAEFVAAILLVAATPFAKKDNPGVSPYVGSDLLQLIAITLTYFLLALAAPVSPRAGRIAALFGALILLTVGLGEAVRLASMLNVFGLTSPPDKQAAATGGP